jgi:hypothetical protein
MVVEMPSPTNCQRLSMVEETNKSKNIQSSGMTGQIAKSTQNLCKIRAQSGVKNKVFCLVKGRFVKA